MFPYCTLPVLLTPVLQAHGGRIVKLTKSKVEGLPTPATGQAFHWDEELRGFGVRVTASGQRSYVAQGRVNGKTRRVTIGEHGRWTCDEARKEAREILRDMDKGIDPQVEKKRKEALDVTLRQVMEDYIDNKRTKNGPLRASSKADIKRHVTQNFADWADEPIAMLTRDKCLKRFNELSERAPSQANQAMVILRALCNWARERHATDDDEYPLLEVNPVQRMLKVKRLNPEDPRDRRIPTEKIGAVWAMLQKRRAEARTVDDRNAAAYVSFLLLTGTRKMEAATLTWSRVNFDEGWFHIPKSIAKNHNALTFPLSATLRELLEAQPRKQGNDYVFASWGKKSGHIGDPRGTMQQVSKIAGLHLSLHDLRRTAEDVAKVCKVDADERRQLLNHLSSDVHGKHYANNPDPKALATAVESMHSWIVGQAAIAIAVSSGDNVLAIRGMPEKLTA